MCKVTDFRIGNYIQDLECEPYIFQVEQISKYFGYESWFLYRKGSIKTKKPEGINLTEKWLLDFGFNKNYKQGYIVKDFLNKNFVLAEPFVIDESQKGYAFKFIDDGCSKYIEFKYVHELQNFYFSITGFELSVIPCLQQSILER